MKKKILVVDDEEQIRDLLEGFLEKDYQVLLASSLLESIKVFKEEKPDLVITDLVMTQGYGTDVRDFVKMESPQTPVILMSGTMHLLPKTERHGFCKYLEKPFRKNDLMQAIKEEI